jgi:3-oxoacyl-[acyl-carrier-protein] synthase II
VAGFSRLGSVAPFVCQPFDKERKGLIPSEGACVLVLETLESAQRRGARIYAEVLGYGVSCDASHITASDVNGIARAIRMAHEMAGVRPEQIDYISAHGTGTILNDLNEVKAIREVFGDHLPPISSIKSMIGHSFGAASAIGLAACALAITRGFIPPTINHLVPDPELDIDCVPNIARECELNIVQNNAFAFGGNNAIVILGRNSNGA